MRGLRSTTGRLLVIGVAAALVAGCSDDGDDVTATESRQDGQEDVDEVTGDVDDFDPDVVDDGLVPEVVDEVVLPDDVIIATEDGQVPTTTIEPPPGPADTVPPDGPAATTTVPPVELPAASSIRRIVSFSATHTDTIAALGAAGLLVGIDGESVAPEAAPIERDQLLVDDLDIVDLQSLDIDLAVIGEDPAGFAAQDLAAAGIAVFDGARPVDRAGVEAQILDLAAALGRAEAGADLVAEMRADIEAVLAALPPSDGLTYFHEIDPGLATYAPGTLVDSLYAELGLRSVVPRDDDANDVLFFPADELLLADPDVVVLGDIDCCGATAARAIGRPGWDSLSAARNGAIVEVPDDVANRFGLNIVELMQRVAAGVAAAS